MSYDFTSSGKLSRTTSLPTTTAFTICCWAYQPAASVADWVLFSLDNGTTQFLQIARFATVGNQYAIWSDQHSGGASGVVLFSEASVLGTWVFYAMVGAPTTSAVYTAVRGQTILTKVTIESSSGTPTGVSVGNDLFPTGQFPGLITRVKAWSAALTAAEIQNEMLTSAPWRTATLDSVLPLIQAPSPGQDWSGFGRNYTETATLTWSRNEPFFDQGQVSEVFGRPLPLWLVAPTVTLLSADWSSTMSAGTTGATTRAQNEMFASDILALQLNKKFVDWISPPKIGQSLTKPAINQAPYDKRLALQLSDKFISWVTPQAVSLWQEPVPRPSGDDPGTRAVPPSASFVNWTSNAAIGPAPTGRILFVDAPALEFVPAGWQDLAVSLASSWVQPPQRPPPSQLFGTVSSVTIQEFLPSDSMRFTTWETSRASDYNTWDSAISFAPNPSFVAWTSAITGLPWSVSRAKNEVVRDDILALQSAYLQDAEPPAVGKWVSGRALNEAIRDQILPLQSAAMQWAEPPAVGKWVSGRALNEATRDAIIPSGYMQWAEPPALGKWSSTRAVNEPTRDTPLGFAPSPSFMGWTSLITGLPWSVQRAQNEATRDDILAIQSAYLQWAEPPQRGAPAKAQRPDPAHPFNATAPPAVQAYVEWFIRSQVGTAVSSRRVDPPQFLGSIVVPVIGEMPWPSDAFRPSWSPAKRATGEQPLTAFALGSLASWSIDLFARPIAQRQPAQDTQFPLFGGSPFVSWTTDLAAKPTAVSRPLWADQSFAAVAPFAFIGWAEPTPPRQAIARRALVADHPLGALVPFGYIGWSDPMRPGPLASPRRAQDQAPFTTQPPPPPSGFSAWSSILSPYRPPRPPFQPVSWSADFVGPTHPAFGPVSGDRIIVVAADGRIIIVAFDDRSVTTMLDSRTISVPKDS